jgi:hypothetical protein
LPYGNMVYLNNRNAILFFGGDWTTQTRLSETWLRSSEGCWTKLNPVASPPLRDTVAMAYDPASGGVVMYGGRVGGPGEAGNFLYDTWTWDGQTWAAASNTGPQLLAPAAAYDPISKQLILFGPYWEGGEAQTWAWTGKEWQRLHPAVSPSGRYAANLTFDSATGQLLLFGGARNSMPLGETWTWNGSTWRQIVTASSPPPRYSAALGSNGSRSGLVLFGGIHPNRFYSDTWIWDGRAWNQVNPSSLPGAAAGVSTDAGLKLLGADGELWGWSGTDWLIESKAVCANSMHPGAWIGQVVYVGNQNAILLFGGDIKTRSVAETWLHSSGCWTKLNPATSPSMRDSMAIGYDFDRRVAVMYGGRVGAPGQSGKFVYDTWTWDGQTWTPIAATGPEIRNPAAAYDPNSRRILLFGQSPRGEAQTWMWTGQTWQLLHPATSPSGRGAVSLAIDWATGQLLLFGGAQTLGPVGETWTWDGSTWRQIFPGSSPSPRQGSILGANRVAPGLVLFGGADSSPFIDTWIWDGHTWSQATPSHVPPQGFSAGVSTGLGLELIARNGEIWGWSGVDWYRIA